MRARAKLFMGFAMIVLALGIPSLLWLPSAEPWQDPSKAPAEARLADARQLEARFASWKADYEENGGNRDFQVALGWARGLSSEQTDGRGLARIDMIRGAAHVEVDGLDPAEGWDVWMIDNQEGPHRSTLPESGDLMHKLGRLTRNTRKTPQGNHAVLDTRFDGRLFETFQVDVVAVTRKGVRPEDGTVLFGSPILFQRLYTKASHAQARPAPGARLAALFGPPAAFADTPFNSMNPLIAQGADLFFNETFGGNGRTCGTCHPAENNFTIDPEFISHLRQDDPLFVGENNPALGERFEKSKLLRGLGLVLENVDGLDDLDNKFVMRGVPHLEGLSRYLLPGNASDLSTVPPNQRTGWGGDGAPGSGTLRDFATGAVVQHFTRSLDRTPGTDFRLPTDAELDAMEAFQLALGRQDNPVIAAIVLRNPAANLGRVQHNGPNARCNVCHVNAGANSPAAAPTNRNFDIGVGRLTNHPADQIDPGNLKPDGGFGTSPVYDAVTGDFMGYGNSNGQIRFNTMPAIESVDTPPFFHNNAVSTIEEAVDFYNTDAFKKSFAGGLIAINMDPTEVQNIATFLRVMNALENIRGSNAIDTGAIAESDRTKAKRLAFLASFDTQDGWEVLEPKGLHPVAVAKLKEAYVTELAASFANSKVVRNALLSHAIHLKDLARADMIVE
jgi:cytochrome c peroxidase